MEKIQNILANWSDSILSNLSTILLAIGVLVVFAFLGKATSRIVYKLMNRVSKNVAVNRLLGTFSALITVLIGILISLNVLGLHTAVASLLAGAGIAGIALGFAFQDLAANLIAGVTVAMQKPFKVGDLVRVDNYFGIVKKINLRMTELETLKGKTIYIPNKAIVGSSITDYTKMGIRRVDIRVGVSYKEDLETVKKVALEALADVDGVLTDKPIEIFFKEFNSYSIDFIARFWIPFEKQPDFLRARSQAIMNIRKAFKENGITIPFPIRTLDFGENTPKFTQN